MEYNRLNLKAFLLALITEIRTGYQMIGRPTYPNWKRQYKNDIGVKPNISNRDLLIHLRFTYLDNDLVEDFDKTLQLFGLEVSQDHNNYWTLNDK